MEKVFLRPFHAPSVSISGFEENVKSNSLQPYQLIVDQNGKQRQFEFLPQPERVAILLFHRKLKRFMVLRRFRPAVFVSRVLQLPGNEGKRVHEIDWSLYDRERGCTSELVTGDVEDKKRHVDDTALAVLEEEMGYRVDKKYLKHVQTFVTGVTESGSPCHIYYAELDKAEKMGEGRVEKIPEVQRIWLGMAAAQAEVQRKEADPLLSSLHQYALIWWFQTMYHTAVKPTMEQSTLFGLDTRCVVSERRQYEREMAEGKMEGRLRFETIVPLRQPVLRINYQIMGLDASCDMTVRLDTVAVLIKDDERKEWVMTRRERPAVLVGRVRAMPENEGKSLEQIDFSAYPGVWAYTQELASGTILDGETARNAVLRVAATKLGYRIREKELKFVARLVIGSSAGGESKYLFYAECRSEDRIEEWKEMEGVKRISFPRWKAALHLKSHSSPPSVFVVKQWLMWNERKETEAEEDAAFARRRTMREKREEMQERWRIEDREEWLVSQAERLKKEEEERKEKEEEEKKRKREEDAVERGQEAEVRNGEGGEKKDEDEKNEESEMRKRRNDASDEKTETKRRREDTVEGVDERTTE